MLNLPTHAKPLESAPGYFVDSIGRVFSTTNWRGHGTRQMAETLNSDNYPSVRLTINGTRKHLTVHGLVAKAFLNPRPSATCEIRHLDGDKHNNFWRNLAWGTAQDNADDRARHGNTQKGAKHAAAIKHGINKSTNPFFHHARKPNQ